MIKSLPHQLVFAEKIWQILKETGYVYLAGKPRSGKTYTAILCAEKSDKISSVLVLTKKAAISGWYKFIDGNTNLKHKYYVTNYEQVGRVVAKSKTLQYHMKLNPEDYDLVIIDESHNLGKLGRPSNRIKLISKLCHDMPHIHLSGTAIVESPCGIYAQMNISKYSPFHHKNFYQFHKEYGEPYYITAGGRDINMYDKAKVDELLPIINQFTVYMTQEDAGIDKSLQSVDKLHYVELRYCTRMLYNDLQKNQVVSITKGMITDKPKYDNFTNYKDMCIFATMSDTTLVADSTMKLRTSLHMMESGIAKVDDEYIELGNTEKIDYIMKEFGDEEDVGIMCHFIGERRLLSKRFKKAKIYSSNAQAEGVDLSHLKSFIILSSDYSGSKFIQRRDRIVNINGSNTLTVHHILVKKAISEQVYKKVNKKEDFNNSTYERATL